MSGSVVRMGTIRQPMPNDGMVRVCSVCRRQGFFQHQATPASNPNRAGCVRVNQLCSYVWWGNDGTSVRSLLVPFQTSKKQHSSFRKKNDVQGKKGPNTTMTCQQAKCGRKYDTQT